MNINQERWACGLFLGAILPSAILLTSPLFVQQEHQQPESSADAARGLSQTEGGKVNARHVVGLENIKRNLSGTSSFWTANCTFKPARLIQICPRRPLTTSPSARKSPKPEEGQQPWPRLPLWRRLTTAARR